MRTRLAAAVFGAVLALAAAPAFAAPLSELHISGDGKFSAKNVLVYQVSGTTLFCRVVWGNAFVRLTALTSANTNITKKHGGAATVSDIAAGDIINLQGTLSQNADTILVDATQINDLSLNREPKTISGTIKSILSGTFVLVDKKLGTVSVSVGTSTITKGARTIVAAELVAGDKVLSASGIYDFASSTFAANTITVYQDQAVFKARTFEGTLRGLPGAALPTTLIVSTAAADYQVYLPATAKVLSKSFAPTELTRFAAGDKVRLYGAIRKTNLAEIDATIVRDLNF